MDEPERRALTAEYHSVKTRRNQLAIGFWVAASLGIALVCVGELWTGVALWIGVGLLLSAAAIWIAWSDFIRGPVQRQRERVEAASLSATDALLRDSLRGMDSSPQASAPLGD